MIVRSFFILLLVAIGAWSEGPGDHCHVWKSDAAYDKAIVDVDQWAADNFSDTPGAKVEQWKLERFRLDIDHDRVAELFVTSPLLHGTGGGPHLVFKKRGPHFYYIGQLGGRQQTMRVLPLGPDGLPRVLTFWSGGSSGVASVWKGDGRQFIKVSSEEIHSGDSGTVEGRARFEALFGATSSEPAEPGLK